MDLLPFLTGVPANPTGKKQEYSKFNLYEPVIIETPLIECRCLYSANLATIDEFKSLQVPSGEFF